MNPFTGGCHFSNGCTQFRKDCGNCGQVCNAEINDISAWNMGVKRNAFAGHKMNVVSPSEWLLREAKSSPVWPAQTSFLHIPYGLDVKRFHPIDKSLARKRLGLPDDRVIMGFGSDNLANPRKGFDYLSRAVKQLPRASDTLHGLVFGGGNVSTGAGLPGCSELGFVDNSEQLVLAYSACDFFVVPSLEDNQPQTAWLESLACGTPVVGFRSGGIPEIVRDSVEGLLVERASVKDLARAIEWMVRESETRSLMGRRARLRAVNEFNSEKQAKAYLTLYHELGHTSSTKIPRVA
ncbi:MAG: glycosyltransferase [Pirellulaceae bacterium]